MFNNDDEADFEQETEEVDTEAEDFEDSDDAEEEAGWYHLGYYVRRVNGDLVLVQTLLAAPFDDDQAAESDIHTVYIDQSDLELAWIEAIQAQGEHLEDGKSCEFIPPDEEEDVESDEEDFYEEDV